MKNLNTGTVCDYGTYNEFGCQYFAFIQKQNFRNEQSLILYIEAEGFCM